jgi:hypothetical protein
MPECPKHFSGTPPENEKADFHHATGTYGDYPFGQVDCVRQLPEYAFALAMRRCGALRDQIPSTFAFLHPPPDSGAVSDPRVRMPARTHLDSFGDIAHKT